MDQKVKEITCDKCGKRHIVSVLRGCKAMNEFTCPECSKSIVTQGFLEIITPERARVILSQANIHHQIIWIVFGISSLCCLVCCGILHFSPESFSKPDILSSILFLALNGSWYIPIIGILIMIPALIDQGFLSYKLVTIASAVVSLSLLFAQTKFFISPYDLTTWLIYLIVLVIIAGFGVIRVL